jgi:hypothetical protein
MQTNKDENTEVHINRSIISKFEQCETHPPVRQRCDHQPSTVAQVLVTVLYLSIHHPHYNGQVVRVLIEVLQTVQLDETHETAMK